MRSLNLKARRRTAATATVIAAVCTDLPISRSVAAGADNQKAGQFAEQLVQVQTKDDMVDSGALFAPPTGIVKPIAVIWVHGWEVNFYFPTYVVTWPSSEEAIRGPLTTKVL